MPFTVITLKNTPKSLRGDLSKWMQEIAVGVYIGNFNSKVREKLWERVIENVGVGEATISYNYRNEIGYTFQTHNTNRKLINYDGIPLVILEKPIKESPEKRELGFSNASKFRKIRKYSNKPKVSNTRTLVFIDIETDGLNEKTSNILEIGAIKLGDKISEFHKVIKVDESIPKEITRLTGITNDEISKGEALDQSLKEFIEFIDNFDLVGYNLNFDVKFLNEKLDRLGFEKINNNTYDLMEFVKKDNPFLENYKLQTAVNEYGINKNQVHRALDDAKLTYELSLKVKRFVDFLKRK